MIEWARQAIRQLDQAYGYIALSNSENVSRQVTSQIIKSIERLAAFPMLGRLGRVPGAREAVIPETLFIAAYTLQTNRIVILAIYHGAQKWPDAF
ncbi:MAG: type II toxin-antitoxin system RelE/ParE family toxin [Terriglobales bacterium]